MDFYTTTTFRKSIEGLTKKTEVYNESKSCMLHQVDIAKGLKELNLNASLSGDKQKE